MALAAISPSAEIFFNADARCEISEDSCDRQFTELKPFVHSNTRDIALSSFNDMFNNAEVSLFALDTGRFNLQSYTDKIRRLSSSNSLSSCASDQSLSDVIAQLDDQEGLEGLSYLEPLFQDQTDTQEHSPLNMDDDDSDSVMLEYDDLDFLDDKACRKREPSRDSLDYYLQSKIIGSEIVRKNNLPPFTQLVQSLTPRQNNAVTCNGSRPHSDSEEMSDEMLSEDEEEYVVKKSKRGAKNVLLWKFLLKQLESRPDLIKWVNRREGSFRFVDTHAVSHMWGEEKRKKDMNFEKLSRGIRHYYKSGMMSRQGGTRLVYKFNWKKVPPQFRIKNSQIKAN